MCTQAFVNFHIIGNFMLISERELRDLNRQLRKSKKAAFASGTHSNLHTQWKSFLIFCIYFNFQPTPVSVQTLCLYAQFLARSFKAVSSIRNYISGVKMLHILVDIPCPSFGSTELNLALRGMTRRKQHTPHQALPITPIILSQIFGLLDMTQACHTVFWALFLIAFYTMARKSNLVPTTVNTFDSKKQLCRGDVLIEQDCILVTYKWSKTNQFYNRTIRVPLLSVPNSILCPVSAYRNMLNKVKAKQHQAAFSLPSKKGPIPVTYRQFQSVLRELLQSLGFSPLAYSTHSFRRGGATCAFRAQVPPDLIQAQGDWVSDAYKKYLQFDITDRAGVSARMSAYVSQQLGVPLTPRK